MRKKQTADTGISSHVIGTLREGALWVFGALALIIWVALFTYSPTDPGFTHASGGGDVQNAVGTAGAYLADLLFNLFGRPAYLFTVMVFYAGWMIYRERRTMQHLTRADVALRLTGFVLTLVTSCALASLHFSTAGFRESAGGIVGQVLGGGLESVMKLLGASVLLFFIWLAAVALFLNISWLAIMDRVGRWSLVAWEYLQAKLGELRDKAEGRRYQQARQDIVVEQKKKAASRAKVRIEPVLPTLEKSVRAEKERQVPLFEPPEAGELPHCRCSMIRRSRRPAIPRNRYRRCRG